MLGREKNCGDDIYLVLRGRIYNPNYNLGERNKKERIRIFFCIEMIENLKEVRKLDEADFEGNKIRYPDG